MSGLQSVSRINDFYVRREGIIIGLSPTSPMFIHTCIMIN